MTENDSIFKIKSYGKINMKLKSVLDGKNMTRNYLARAVNTRFEVIDKWYAGNVEKIDADILARICYVLNCPVSDLLEYVPEEKEVGK